MKNKLKSLGLAPFPQFIHAGLRVDGAKKGLDPPTCNTRHSHPIEELLIAPVPHCLCWNDSCQPVHTPTNNLTQMPCNCFGPQPPT